MRPNCVYGTICTSALVPMRGAPWAEELARALGGKKLGKQWSACCPAHDDKSPSLIIFEGRTGAVQVRCMAGCEPIEIIAEIRWHEVADRLSMMHRDGWTGNRVSNPTAFAWFVWERDYTGKPEIDRISLNRGAS